jgi:outer membrane protein assembly factor BamB
MSESVSTPTQPVFEAGSDVHLPKPLRLRFPIGLVLIFWALHFVVGSLEKPYFYGFLFQMASSGLSALFFFPWWWFNRSVRLSEKLLGFILIAAGGMITGTFSHRSINGWTLFLSGLPLVMTFIVGWMWLVKRKLISPNRLGFVAVVALTWSWFLVIRTDGLNSTLKAQNHWRWTPTAEESFLAQKPAGGEATNPSQPAAASRTPLRSSLGSDSWTAFRGPDRDGVVHGTRIATDWKGAPPPQLWKHKVGPAWSSVIVVDDRLFTQEQRGTVETVVCYDAATGTGRKGALAAARSFFWPINRCCSSFPKAARRFCWPPTCSAKRSSDAFKPWTARLGTTRC